MLIIFKSRISAYYVRIKDDQLELMAFIYTFLTSFLFRSCSSMWLSNLFFMAMIVIFDIEAFCIEDKLLENKSKHSIRLVWNACKYYSKFLLIQRTSLAIGILAFIDSNNTNLEFRNAINWPGYLCIVRPRLISSMKCRAFFLYFHNHNTQSLCNDNIKCTKLQKSSLIRN